MNAEEPETTPAEDSPRPVRSGPVAGGVTGRSDDADNEPWNYPDADPDVLSFSDPEADTRPHSTAQPLFDYRAHLSPTPNLDAYLATDPGSADVLTAIRTIRAGAHGTPAQTAPSVPQSGDADPDA